MRGQPRFKRKVISPRIKGIIVATFVFFFLFIFLSIWLINRGIEPTLMEIAEEKTKQFAIRAVNQAVNKKMAENLQFEDLIQIEEDNSGDIVYMGWNSVEVNRMLRDTTNRVQNFLLALENGEMPESDTPLDDSIEPPKNPTLQSVRGDPTLTEIPIGQATGLAILSNLGPKVPVNFEVIGSVRTDVLSEVTPFGINNALVEIDIHLVVDVRIVIPFSTGTATIEQKIPVDQGVIRGKVPDFYSDGEGKDTFSIPIGPKKERE